MHTFSIEINFTIHEAPTERLAGGGGGGGGGGWKERHAGECALTEIATPITAQCRRLWS